MNTGSHSHGGGPLYLPQCPSCQTEEVESCGNANSDIVQNRCCKCGYLWDERRSAESPIVPEGYTLVPTDPPFEFFSKYAQSWPFEASMLQRLYRDIVQTAMELEVSQDAYPFINQNDTDN